MIHKNIDLLFQKDKIPEIEKQLNDEIPKILSQLCFKTKEPLKITYEIIEHIKGFSCKGTLYFGEKMVREYDHIDELFYDLFRYEGHLMLKRK